jgi:hypothetical protein
VDFQLFLRRFAMRECEIKGLMELKQGYEARLARLPANKEYTELSDEFHATALNMVREAVIARGISLDDVPYRGQLAVGQAADCGFCTVCVTACTTCVAYM